MTIKNVLIFVCLLFFGIGGYAQTITASSNSEFYVVRMRAKSKATGEIVKNARGFLTIPGPSLILYTSSSNDSGIFKFLVKWPLAGNTLIFLPESPDILMEKGFPFTARYKLNPLNNDISAQPDNLPFYGMPDKSYSLDDYTRFSTLEEVFIEYVAEVRLRKQKDSFRLEVQNTPYRTFFEQSPLVLLDGVPVSDLNALMSIDPLSIKKLDVVARKYYYGSLVCYGIVSLSTYDGKMGGYPLPAEALVVEYSSGGSAK